MPAILFGSISALADTSELQRQAFNDAFAEHGLDWHWDQERYRELLTSNGGAQRIADVADQRGDDADAEAVHATKSRLFQERVVDGDTTARPGVLETLEAARREDVSLGLVTTTSPANVDAILAALDLDRDDFDVVLTSDDVDRTKPDPQAYEVALERLGVDPADAVAIEDNVGGAQAAAGAGVTCLATPNTNTMGHDFGSTTVVQALDAEAVVTQARGDTTTA